VSRLAVVPELEKELDHLYELPPAEFTAARNTLARRLKDTGQREVAARVQALRKPTVPVWVINQLARRHPDQVNALVAAADELRKAQEAALKEGAQERLREATTAERDAVRTLAHGAQEVLQERPAAAVLDRIASTLRAAALDADARELLTAGRLNEELEPTGFGGLADIPVPATPKRPQKRAPARPSAEERRLKERLRKLRERADKLAAAANEAERDAERAESEAARERRKADRARAAADRARAELDAASGATRP
jgi:hypothetical protein